MALHNSARPQQTHEVTGYKGRVSCFIWQKFQRELVRKEVRVECSLLVDTGSVPTLAGSDVIILVMNKSGMEKLLKSKFTSGGDATAAAGPVGREADAQTDALMHAEMLTWAKSRGAFAGISLDGSTMRPDDEANKELYGKNATNLQILTGKFPVPDEAKSFVTALDKFSPHKA